MKLSLYTIESLLDKLLKKDYYYLVTMSFYHIELIIFGILGLIPFWYEFHTFFPLYFDSSSLSAQFLDYEIGYNAETVFYTFLILLLDITFLFIVRSEIGNLQIKNNTKYWFYPSKKAILIIECFIFYFNIGNPIMRMILYFMSLNTIQIYFTYRYWLKIPVIGKIWLFGSYLYIIMLTISPLREIIYLILKFGV